MTNFPALTQTSAPAAEPLTLTETKAYLRFPSASDDSLITSLITTVRKAAEGYMRSSLITQSWKLSYDKYTPACVILPFGPAQSITSVTAFARDGSSSVIASSTYYLSSGNRRLVFDASVLSHRIEIVYVAGYGTAASAVPSPIKYGMLAHLAAIYEGRAGEHSIPRQSVEFYVPYREVRV
jgi:uncharacterized phiE125 gp8 family phage protein